MTPSSQSRQVGVANYLVLALVVILLAGAVLVRFIGEEESPVSTDVAGLAIDTAADEGSSGGSTSTLSREGAAAPDFTLLDIDGDPITLSQWHGRPVLINFWATWCAPCEIEMPAIQASYLAHQDEGLVVLAIAVDDSVENVRRFFKEHDLGFRPLMDDRTASQAYQVFGLPTSYFISPDGKIAAAHTGVLTEEKISAYLGAIEPN